MISNLKMQIKKRLNKRGSLAISQILILIIGIIAIGYVIGEVNAKDQPKEGDKKVAEPKKENELPNPTNIADLIASGATLKSVEEMFGKNVKTPLPEINTGSPKPSWLKKIFDKEFGKEIWKGFQWAAGVVAVIQLVGRMSGVDEDIVNSASIAASSGIMVGKALKGWRLKKSFLGVGLPTLIGIGVGIAIFYFTYKKQKTKVVTFECYQWDAATGGEKCEECNNQGILGCSEYQCRSLGQNCELINKGTEEEKCVWINRNDVSPPAMKPWDNALLEGYEYKPIKKEIISPPELGVWIWNKDATDGCVKAFTPLSFGINIVAGGVDDGPEPASCKIDTIRKKDFESMDFYFGGSSTRKYNHTQTMSLPGPEALGAENITIENEGEYELYVRCMDSNDNYNTANFVFKYCVEKGPDTTPPLIVGTNPQNSMPIAYQQSEVDITVYINEPSECRWSQLDQSYKDMEHNMKCPNRLLEINAQMLYECETTLTGLNDNVENKFYFRCKDKPLAEEKDRNVNMESYKFILFGTQPLVIDKVGPNGTVRDSTPTVTVTLTAETSAGYEEGKSNCYYSNTGQDDDYALFFNTDSYKHSQELGLEEGHYKYYIKCLDLGGNFDIKEVEFDVESDTEAPIVVRAYKDGSNLRIMTNEKAECVYDNKDCSYPFEEGLSMIVRNDIEHYIDWNTKTTLYIKCTDEYGNKPAPDKCSIIVRPFDFGVG